MRNRDGNESTRNAEDGAEGDDEKFEGDPDVYVR